MTTKPYVFNNYELTAPKKERGYYTSYQVQPPQQIKSLEKVEGIQLTIDLTDVKSKQEVFDRVYPKLGFFYEPNMYSWDALGDYLWNFPESSGVFNEINPGVVHLRIINLNHVWKFSERDYGILCEILITATDNSRFDGGFRMIIEAINY